MVDNGFIKNKNLLPIISISFGPMPYESQSAKVKLGPLTCHPLPENERYAIKDQIISIKKNITKTNAQLIEIKEDIATDIIELYAGIDTKMTSMKNWYIHKNH